jgi:hypothetical protein
MAWVARGDIVVCRRPVAEVELSEAVMGTSPLSTNHPVEKVIYGTTSGIVYELS